MARIHIRKLEGGLVKVNVKRSRPGEGREERASIVTPEELEETIAAKLERIKPKEPGVQGPG